MLRASAYGTPSAIVPQEDDHGSALRNNRQRDRFPPAATRGRKEPSGPLDAPLRFLSRKREPIHASSAGSPRRCPPGNITRGETRPGGSQTGEIFNAAEDFVRELLATPITKFDHVLDSELQGSSRTRGHSPPNERKAGIRVHVQPSPRDWHRASPADRR